MKIYLNPDPCPYIFEDEELSEKEIGFRKYAQKKLSENPFLSAIELRREYEKILEKK